MQFVARLVPLVVLLSVAVPFVAATSVARTNSQSCASNEFFYEGKSCCVPNSKPSSTPSAPSGKSCPTTDSWYWSNEKDCCLPTSPPKPTTPSCKDGHSWDQGSSCCTAPPSPPAPGKPTPSKSWGHQKRSSHKSRNISMCPTGLDACPILGLHGVGNDYECIDTKTELESCGGCASTGQGQDCSAIKGAWNVACEVGACVVYTCAAGFKRAADGKSCLPLA